MYPVIIFLLISLSIEPLYANTIVPTESNYSLYQDSHDKKKNKQLKKSRKLFKQALTALEKNNIKLFNQLFKKLKDYPLIVFLDYKKLRKNINKAKNKDIHQFIKQYQNTPYADKVRKKWLDKLAKRKYWKSYLEFYTPQKSVRRQCNYLYALIKNQKKSEAFKQVKSVWLSAKSQPKNCNVVFKAWQDAGYITDELRWQRIQLAMTKGRVSLAKYLSKTMSKADKAILSEWVALHRKPKKILTSKILTGQHQLQQQIILHSIKRQARKKPEQAVKLLAAIQKKIQLDPAIAYQAYKAIGLSFARKHQLGGWFWLDKIPDGKSDLYVQEWRVRAAIREQKNKAVISAIKRLPEEKQQSQRWQFWLANAMLLVNEKKGDKLLAENIYQELAQHRGYYAFLAADKISKDYAFNDKAITYEPKKFAQIKKFPSIKRAFEFYILGMKTEAKREWYYATQYIFNHDQQVLAAKLAQSWGWHDRAIITIAHTDERDDMRLRFPLLLEKSVEKYSRLNQLDAAYTYAVIRRESAFAIEARSPVGAMGLMQIMPATGKQVARKLKLPYKNKGQLYSTDFNLKLGTNYLQSMLSKFHHQPVLASAAYNAGGHRVKAWLPEDKSLNAVDWVESIPFKETREYVSAILAYTAIYQHRLGKPVTRLTHRMPDIPIKK